MAPPLSNLHYTPSLAIKTSTTSNHKYSRVSASTSTSTSSTSSYKPNRAARRRNYVVMRETEGYRETNFDDIPIIPATLNHRVPAIGNTAEFPPIGDFNFQPPTPVRHLNDHREDEQEKTNLGVGHYRMPVTIQKHRAQESLLGKPGGFNETPEQAAAAAAAVAASSTSTSTYPRKIHPLPHTRRQPSTSSPHPLTMSTAAGTSLTHRSAEYDLSRQFERLKIQGQHLGLTRSPYFPRSKEELVRHREERKYDQQHLMKRRIELLEEVKKLKEERKWVRVEVDKALGGEQKGIWGVLGAESIWDRSRKGKAKAEWPTLGELKRGGRNGLPVPRMAAREGTLGREVILRGLDRVGYPVSGNPEIARFNERSFLNREVIRHFGY
ncbi:hypothetical protein ACMFMF_001754 [Clarireedia jacksonii]